MARLGRFAATRLLTGGLGLVWVVAMARWMPVGEYAQYAVVLAAVALAAVIGTLGVDRALMREIPLAQLNGNRTQILRLIRLASAVRLVMAPIATIAVYLLTGSLDRTQGHGSILLFGLALSASFVLNDVLQIAANALLRFEVQSRIASAMLAVRLGLAAALNACEGGIGLFSALIIVLTGDLLQSLLSWFLAVRPALPVAASARSPIEQISTSPYAPPTLRALARSAATNYFAYLCALPWQGAAAILLVGSHADPSEVALFALLQNTLERLRQYLPLQLLQNAFEPILVRRFAQGGKSQPVAHLLDLLRRCNSAVLLAAAALAWVCGSELIEAATGGKYTGGGPMAALLLTSLAVRGISAVLYIGANVTGEMSQLMRIQAIVTLLLIGPLVLAAMHCGAAGVILVSTLSGWALWLGLRLLGATSARGLFSWQAEGVLLLSAAAATLAGTGLLWFMQKDASVAMSLIAAGLALLCYGTCMTLFRAFPSRDLTMLKQALEGSDS